MHGRGVGKVNKFQKSYITMEAGGLHSLTESFVYIKKFLVIMFQCSVHVSYGFKKSFDRGWVGGLSAIQFFLGFFDYF